MKNLQLKNLAAISFLFMLFAVSVSVFAQNGIVTEEGSGLIAEQVMAGDVQQGIQMEYKEEYEEDLPETEIAEEGLVGYLSVPKNSEDKSGYLFEDLYINRQISLTVNNSQKNFYKKNIITYYVVDEIYEEMEVVNNIDTKYLKDKEKTVITFDLNGVYEYEIKETEDAYLIRFFDLHSIYDKIIVVDAGHGGGDNGCGSRDSVCYEKMVTLAVVKELKEKLDNTDIKVYYTRLEDKNVYLRPRVRLANDVGADMFVSIHCNYYDRYWLYDVDGSETLYSSVRKSVAKDSKKLAQIMLDNLAETTTLSKRSVIDRGVSLYILKKSKVPATIVEMGYMSDREDLKYLLSEKKRKKIVNGLYNGIIAAYKKMYGKTVEEIKEEKLKETENME